MDLVCEHYECELRTPEVKNGKKTGGSKFVVEAYSNGNCYRQELVDQNDERLAQRLLLAMAAVWPESGWRFITNDFQKTIINVIDPILPFVKSAAKTCDSSTIKESEHYTCKFNAPKVVDGDETGARFVVEAFAGGNWYRQQFVDDDRRELVQRLLMAMAKEWPEGGWRFIGENSLFGNTIGGVIDPDSPIVKPDPKSGRNKYVS